ncbi:hypothetical protein H8E52_12140 [bacterium]|nr:hypothetical protein [bacterium]
MNQATLDWFEYGAEVLEPFGGGGYFGVPDAEIYNWAWFGRFLQPPTAFRTNEFVPLLNYVVANNRTRFGTDPVWNNDIYTANGQQYREAFWSVKYDVDDDIYGADSLWGGAAGPEHGLHIAVMGMPAGTDHKNVAVGFHPYYLDRGHAKLLIDHILVDILEVPKELN